MENIKTIYYNNDSSKVSEMLGLSDERAKQLNEFASSLFKTSFGKFMKEGGDIYDIKENIIDPLLEKTETNEEVAFCYFLIGNINERIHNRKAISENPLLSLLSNLNHD